MMRVEYIACVVMVEDSVVLLIYSPPFGLSFRVPLASQNVTLYVCVDDNFRSASCWVSLSCDRGECVIFADGEVVYVAWYCVRLFFLFFFSRRMCMYSIDSFTDP